MKNAVHCSVACQGEFYHTQRIMHELEQHRVYCKSVLLRKVQTMCINRSESLHTSSPGHHMPLHTYGHPAMLHSIGHVPYIWAR